MIQCKSCNEHSRDYRTKVGTLMNSTSNPKPRGGDFIKSLRHGHSTLYSREHQNQTNSHSLTGRGYFALMFFFGKLYLLDLMSMLVSNRGQFMMMKRAVHYPSRQQYKRSITIMELGGKVVKDSIMVNDHGLVQVEDYQPQSQLSNSIQSLAS